jgi:hypothetical protein
MANPRWFPLATQIPGERDAALPIGPIAMLSLASTSVPTSASGGASERPSAGSPGGIGFAAVFDYLEVLHNRTRRHSALDLLTRWSSSRRSPWQVFQLPGST